MPVLYVDCAELAWEVRLQEHLTSKCPTDHLALLTKEQIVLLKLWGLILAGVIIGAVACGSPENSSTNAGGGNAGCPDCITVAEIMADYNANALRAELTHLGKRYSFSGEVESIEDSGIYSGQGKPPIPLVRVMSGGKRAIFWLPSDFDNRWVLEYNKGDEIVANCKINSLADVEGREPSGEKIERGTPSLHECTEQR